MGVFLSTKSTYTPSNMQEYYELYRDPAELARLQGLTQNTKQSNQEFQTLLEDTAKLDAYIKGLKEGDDMKRAYNDFNTALKTAANSFYKDGFNDKTASELRNLRIKYQSLIPAISRAFTQYEAAQKDLAPHLNSRIYYANDGELTPYDVQASDYFGGKTPQFNNYISKKEAEADATKMANKYFQTVYSKGKAPDIEGFDLDWIKTTHGVKPNIVNLENWVNNNPELRAIRELFKEKYNYNLLDRKQKEELDTLFYNGIVEGLHYNETQTPTEKPKEDNGNTFEVKDGASVEDPKNDLVDTADPKLKYNQKTGVYYYDGFQVYFNDQANTNAFIRTKNNEKKYLSYNSQPINATTLATLAQSSGNNAITTDKKTSPEEYNINALPFISTNRKHFGNTGQGNLSTVPGGENEHTVNADDLIDLILGGEIYNSEDGFTIPTLNITSWGGAWDPHLRLNPSKPWHEGANHDALFLLEHKDVPRGDSLSRLLNKYRNKQDILKPQAPVIAFVRGGNQVLDNNTRTLLLYHADAFLHALENKYDTYMEDDTLSTEYKNNLRNRFIAIVDSLNLIYGYDWKTHADENTKRRAFKQLYNKIKGYTGGAIPLDDPSENKGQQPEQPITENNHE